MAINPYAGNSASYPITIPIPDNSAGPTATTIMAPVEQNRDGIANLNARVEGARARNWQAPIAWSLSAGPYLVHWNDSKASFFTGLRWIAAGWSSVGPVITVLSFTGQGDAGVSVGTGAASATPPSSLVNDASGNLWMAAPATASGSSAANVFTVSELPVGTSTWTQTVNTGAIACSQVKLAAIGNTVLCAVGSSTGGLASLGVLIAGAYVPHMSSLTAPVWIVHTNGTYVLAIAGATGAGAIAYKSSDGVTWTAGTASLGGAIGSTDVVIDAAWNAFLSLWLAAVSVGGTGTTTFYTSPDGVAWTNTGTTLTGPYQGSSLAYVGQIWVYAGFSPSSGAPTNSSRVMYTFDGVTFYYSQGLLFPAVANVPMVRASPTQIALAACLPAADTTDATALRFSLDVGIPDQVVS